MGGNIGTKASIQEGQENTAQGWPAHQQCILEWPGLKFLLTGRQCCTVLLILDTDGAIFRQL